MMIVYIAIGIMIGGFIGLIYLLKKFMKGTDWKDEFVLPEMPTDPWHGWTNFKRHWKGLMMLPLLLLIFGLGWTFFSSENKNNYIELAEILENKETYVGKVIFASGDIVKAPGFKVYYSLVNQEIVNNNINPYQGLDLHNVNMEQFVKYDYPREGPAEYIQRASGPISEVLLRGELVDRGKITDAARYSFKIIEIQELNVIN